MYYPYPSLYLPIPCYTFLYLGIHPCISLHYTGNESHAGQVFTCVGALAVAGAVEDADADLLGWW